MTDYSLIFQVEAKAGKGDSWKSFSGEEIEVGLVESFGGSFKCMSPENLYAHSLANCFIATFKVLARNSGLEFEKVEVDGRLRMDKKEEGILLDHIDLDIKVEKPSEHDLAEKLLEKASRSCRVLSSVKTEKEFEFSIV